MLSHFLSKREIDNFKKAVDLYSKFQGIDDGVFTEEDFNDFLGFLSFDFASPEHFKRTIISAFYEEDNRSVASQRSNRSRDFQASQIQNREEPNKSAHGDFRKNKEGGHEKEEHENDDHFDQFHEELHGDDKKSVSRYSEVGKKEVPTGHLKEVESIILRMKKRLATKGTKGFLFFEKAMKNADLDKDTLVNFEEFKQVIKEQRIDITNTECNHIFDVFDEQGTGLISFPEFMFTLRGKMPEVRKNLSEKLWNQIKVSE
jgi:Ca2+-binding EF-hand superfamily protein